MNVDYIIKDYSKNYYMILKEYNFKNSTRFEISQSFLVLVSAVLAPLFP